MGISCVLYSKRRRISQLLKYFALDKYTPMAYTYSVRRSSLEIIETPVFTKRMAKLFTDEEYSELQWALIINPEAGAIIPGGGGIRKLRWALPGSGKRGGLRIIYYLYTQDEKIYLLLPYKKSEQEDLTAEQIKILSNYVREG